MGSSVTRVVSTCVYGPYKILVLGLEGAGKSTVLRSLNLGEVVTKTHPGGQISESLKYSSFRFTAFDLEGPDPNLKNLPKNFLKKTDGVIFVVDRSDEKHVQDAQQALHKLMEEKEMKNVILLVIANKEDLPDPRTDLHISYRLKLQNLPHSYHVQSANACTGDGLFEAIHWLIPVVSERKFLLPWQKPVRRW